MSQLDEIAIEAVYNFVREGHSGQTDLSGVDYIHHLTAVADRLRSFNDTPLIKRALGHDYIEDVPDGRKRIENSPFSSEDIVTIESLSSPPRQKGVTHTAHYIFVFIPGLIAKRDLRALLIKVSDNMHNTEPKRNVGESKRDVLRTYRYLFSLISCIAACEELIQSMPEWAAPFEELKRDVAERVELLRVRCHNNRAYIEEDGFQLI